MTSAYPGVPPQSSGKALASLICGIFFFVLPSAVAAIILGHLSLSDIKRSAGRLGGKGLAITGLVLGYLGAAMIPFLIIAAIAIPNLLRARMAANEASAAGTLRYINTANAIYGSTYDNGFATSLEVLGGIGIGQRDCNHAQLIDQQLTTGRKYGYIFTYVAVAQEGKSPDAEMGSKPAPPGCNLRGAERYKVTADPIQRGATGRRSFFTDETGVIRFERDGTATEGSQPIE
jgi:hypothetical protein